VALLAPCRRDARGGWIADYLGLRFAARFRDDCAGHAFSRAARDFAIYTAQDGF
jgi:hypothetical protein